jgi:multiple sugar transport system permease protein
MRRRKLASAIAAHAVLLVAVLLALFPVFWVVLTSFKTNADATAPADRAFDFVPTVANYADVLAATVFQEALRTSVVVTLVTTLLVVVLAFLGGYAFARLQVPGRRLLVAVMVIVQVIPGIVLVIPLFRIISEARLYDQWISLIIVLTGLLTPFATWLMLAFIRSFPEEIEEAAMIDGATRLQLFRHILIPMVAPGMVTAAIFTAIAAWNAFLIPVVLGQSRAQTLTVYVAGFITQQEIKWSELCATAVVILAPIVLFTLVMQRPLVKGITAGSLKS